MSNKHYGFSLLKLSEMVTEVELIVHNDSIHSVFTGFSYAAQGYFLWEAFTVAFSRQFRGLS